MIEVAQVFAQETGRNGGFWLRLRDLNFNTMGFILVGRFVLVLGRLSCRMEITASWRERKIRLPTIW